jgi:hypothetical protein
MMMHTTLAQLRTLMHRIFETFAEAFAPQKMSMIG